MKGKLLVLFFCVSVVFAQDSFEETSQRIAFKVLNDCSVKDDFSVCLKTKAIVFLERLGRMKQFSLSDGISIIRAADVPETQSNITEEQLEKVLPRSYDAKDDAVNQMLLDKLNNYLTSRTVEFSLPKTFEGEARKEGGFGGGGGGGGKMQKNKKGGKGMLIALIGAKIYALGAIAIAGLFLLAKKALIIAKIALLISAIIGLKKLLASKHHHGGVHAVHVAAHDVGYHGGYGGHGGHVGHVSGYGGGHGGWDEGWQGGWQKRGASEAQDQAYSAYSQKQ